MRQIFGTQKTRQKKKIPAIFSQKHEHHFVRGGMDTREHQEEKNTSRVRNWQLWFLWILFFSVFGYQIFFSGILKMERLVIDGTGLLTREEVEQMAQNVLSQKRWAFFPQNNFVLFSQENMEQQLLAASPLIRQVTAKRIFPDTVSISLLERGNFLFWCSDQEYCLLVDEDGILRDWPEAREESRVPHVYLVDETRKPAQAGDYVGTTQFLTFVNGLQQAFLEQAGIRIQDRMSLPSKYADELHLETDKGFSLRINTDIPIEQTLNTLRIVRDKAIPKEKQEDLVEVDLRISGKAFYQLKNEEPAETAVNLDVEQLNDKSIKP